MTYQLYNAILREYLNGALFILSGALTIIITVHMWEVWRIHGRGWTTEPGMKVACAFWWLFLSETIRSFLQWVLLRARNAGVEVPINYNESISLAFTFGALALLVAFFRCIYLFTPDHWGHRYWVFALITTFLFLAATEFLPPLMITH